MYRYCRQEDVPQPCDTLPCSGRQAPMLPTARETKSPPLRLIGVTRSWIAGSSEPWKSILLSRSTFLFIQTVTSVPFSHSSAEAGSKAIPSASASAQRTLAPEVRAHEYKVSPTLAVLTLSHSSIPAAKNAVQAVWYSRFQYILQLLL